MKKIEYKIKNKTGLHARPASKIVDKVSKYDSEVKILNGNSEYNAKSMISIISMGAENGANLEFIIKGNDEEKVYKDLENLLESGLED